MKTSLRVLAAFLLFLATRASAQNTSGLNLGGTGTTAAQTAGAIPYVNSTNTNALSFLSATSGNFIRAGNPPTGLNLFGTANTWTVSQAMSITGTAGGLLFGSDARGDIPFRGASAYGRLAAGTSGQFLQTKGAGLDPVWASAGVTVREADGSPSVTASQIVFENGRVTDSGGGVATVSTVDPQLLSAALYNVGTASVAVSNGYLFFNVPISAGGGTTLSTTLGGNGPGFPPGTLKNLGVSVAGLVSATTTTATVHKNAVATSMACATTSATSGGCADTSNTVSVVAGDGIAIRITQAAAAGLATGGYVVVQAQFVPQ